MNSFYCFVIISFLLSCTHVREEDVSNASSKHCDFNEVTFSESVKLILDEHCSSCHYSSPFSGGIDLSSYSGVAAVAGSGQLYGVISHSPGFPQMPFGKPKMTECSIKKIKVWIDNGYKDN